MSIAMVSTSKREVSDSQQLWQKLKQKQETHSWDDQSAMGSKASITSMEWLTTFLFSLSFRTRTFQ
jgi:hypothetical protein